MKINNLNKWAFNNFYFAIFVINFGFFVFTQYLFSQLQPILFLNKLDVSLNLVYLTSIQNKIISNSGARILMDVLFFSINFLLFLVGFFKSKWQKYITPICILYNLVYSLLLSSMSALSIEGFMPWVICPLVFFTEEEKGYYFAKSLVRYFFLLAFFSAALWKLRTGAIFHFEQMSGILVLQHAQTLAQLPNIFYAKVITYIIEHKVLSYSVYLLGCLVELSYGIGFFTKKYDKYLACLFITFVVFDLLLMQINYFSWCAFLGCLFYNNRFIAKSF